MLCPRLCPSCHTDSVWPGYPICTLQDCIPTEQNLYAAVESPGKDASIWERTASLYFLPCSIISQLQKWLARRKGACWTFLQHSHRCVSCRHVLRRACKSIQGCPVPDVKRDCNSREKREGKDKLWDSHSILGHKCYTTWLQDVCVDPVSV